MEKTEKGAKAIEVPVKMIKLHNKLDIPGRGFTSSVVTTDQVNTRRWQVHYIPSLRHHRIVCWEPGEGVTPTVVYVHESHVASWEPCAGSLD